MKTATTALSVAAAGRAGKRAYREFGIPKRDGSTRTITAPSDHTKAQQVGILRWVEERYKPHASVHGFTANRGVRTAAVAAAEAACMVRSPKGFIVISVDLKDFFPNVRLAKVKQLLRGFGASRTEAQEMAYWATYRGGLPQGSPCSPILANAAAHNLDIALHGLAASRNGFYARYADDLTLIVRKGSSSRQQWLEKVCKLIEAFGFTPHPDKRATKALAGHNGFEVVGITLHVHKGGEVSVRPRRNTVRSARASLVCHKDNAAAIQGGYAQYLLGHQGVYKARKTSEGYFPRYRPNEAFSSRRDVAILLATVGNSSVQSGAAYRQSGNSAELGGC